jgi:uncharacterized protein
MMTFLSAEWRDLVLLNYDLEPELLRPFVPPGTELDAFEGRTLVSIVGFRFLRTRVLGLAIPGLSDFEEVNLRFYVRRREADGWRRGVVFVREIVPSRIIAATARICYGEPYMAMPMHHEIREDGVRRRIRYAWRSGGRWNSLSAMTEGSPKEIREGSEEEFILEHYWGYTARGRCSGEYRVEHPKWRIWQGLSEELDCDIAAIYGERFLAPLSASPSSCIVAEGSPIVVRLGSRVEGSFSAG